MFNQKNNIMVSINKNKDKSIFIYIGNIGTYNKTRLQRLAEGNVVQNSPVSKKN